MSDLDELLQFLREDAPTGDVTSEAVIPDVNCTAGIRAEQDGILAGMDEASALFSHYGVVITSGMRDGDTVKKGDIIMSLSGKAKMILLVERTALNILGRMCGIATRTAAMVAIVKAANPSCRVAGTRKTCPGFRRFDKRAVMIGGGDPHRMNLSDGILIKDNHLALVPLEEALRAARLHSVYKKIEVEVESATDAVKAAKAGADIIMLDNMTPARVQETLAVLKEKGLRDRVTIEISGGIDENTLRDYAACGVDVISMGALTHTVKNFSLSLEILPTEQTS
ncbi:carboxylating nicotinate-nucleotide diphosphorylase [Methanoregula sp.]|uniref:carboxylating nicotinate-nucleotide diphosphorylase n=1 Tax=Methanoregula sp. TaxID=2052170 RepID=UPI00236F3330|nr:carboxylating nicotinate-nucleotide diphosphorylase [Methanoregula sp.]MDD1687752.1 carboxylating nicotinate-nucleotide diphosphorylase [Methanoregula sp.]